MHVVSRNNTIKVWKYIKTQKQDQDLLTMNS